MTIAPWPRVVIDRAAAARTFRAGSQFLRQLYFATLDLELHTRFDPDAGDVLDVQGRVAAENTVLKPLPEDRFLCSFSHIFAGGYAAGYYSYKWAEVLSADAFSAFEEAGLSNPQAVASTGRRFRDTVLALGGSRTRLFTQTIFEGLLLSVAAIALAMPFTVLITWVFNSAGGSVLDDLLELPAVA